ASGLEKDSRRRIPRKVFELDFQEDIDFQAHFRKTKASITLAKSILENQNHRSTTLPADFNYEPQSLGQLFLKPLVKLSQSSDPVGALDTEAGIEDYDYENPNDTSNFCPALQVPDSDDDPDPDANPAEFPSQLPAPPELSRINGENVPGCGELELIAEPQKGEDLGEGTDVEVAGEKILSDLTKDLLHRLPPAMATDLSVPLAFVCLLHLANEKVRAGSHSHRPGIPGNVAPSWDSMGSSSSH
ncbi:Condensin complex subunit 2, partial [Lamprotornis superbus]